MGNGVNQKARQLGALFDSLQCHSGLEDSDIPVTVDLVFGPFLFTGDFQQIVEKLFGQGFHGYALQQLAGVKVDPVGFFLGQAGIGRDFDGGNRSAHRIAPAGGEEDNMGTGGSHGRRRDDVIARAFQQV